MIVGIWGLGSIGLRHAKNAMAQGIEVIGYDPDSGRGDLLTEAGGSVVVSEQDLLNQSEAVVICSPNHLHLDHLKQAIDHGCHILIEKPLAHTDAALEDIFKQAKAKNLVIAPAMNMRFDDVVRGAKDIVQSGELGNPVSGKFVCRSYLPDWRPHQDHRKGYTNDPKTGGVIFDIIHEFDIAYFMLGGMAVKACDARNSGEIGLDVEDVADVTLEVYGQDIPVAIHLDYISQDGERGFEIVYPDHVLKADIDGRVIQVLDKEGAVVREERIEQPDTDCYIDEMRYFIDAVRGGALYPCQPAEALDVLRTVITARKMAGLPA